ncbi:MAG: hypothetical protein J7L39_02645 [Candidatus Aenigmarchaeota archaeon]|nr:hypothetical protein [Candidatus Aenigmarchaeota archaeon]
MTRKGYKVEWKIRKIFERSGWKVVRSGGSFGEADLVCFKNGKCIFLQVKSTRKKEKVFYYYGYMKKKFEGFPFFIVVDFGYGKIRITKPKKKIKINDGIDIKEFLNKFK